MTYTPEVMKAIHIFSILFFGPLLVMVGLLGKKTPRVFFMILLLLGVIVVLYHSVTLYKEMLGTIEEGFRSLSY